MQPMLPPCMPQPLQLQTVATAGTCRNMWLLFKRKDGKNIFDPDVMRGVNKIVQRVITDAQFPDFCLMVQDSPAITFLKANPIDPGASPWHRPVSHSSASSDYFARVCFVALRTQLKCAGRHHLVFACGHVAMTTALSSTNSSYTCALPTSPLSWTFPTTRQGTYDLSSATLPSCVRPAPTVWLLEVGCRPVCGLVAGLWALLCLSLFLSSGDCPSLPSWRSHVHLSAGRPQLDVR